MRLTLLSPGEPLVHFILPPARARGTVITLILQPVKVEAQWLTKAQTKGHTAPHGPKLMA